MKKFQKILITCFVSLLCLSLSGFILAQRELEVTYPDVPGVIRPVTIKTPLPEYIVYIFTLAIYVAGFVVVGSLVYGGFRYLTSSGNTSVMSEARSQIFASVVGLVVLLSSYLLLNTINPEIIEPTGVPIAINWGVILYKGDNCSGDSMEIDRDNADLGEFAGEIQSMRIISPRELLDVKLYGETYFGGEPKTVYGVDWTDPLTGCLDLFPLFVPAPYVASVRLFSRFSGVYLIGERDLEAVGARRVPFEEYIGTSRIPILPAGINDNVEAIRFRSYEDSAFPVRYGVVLHETENFGGRCQVFVQTEAFEANNEWIRNAPNLLPLPVSNPEVTSFGTGTSSVTVFTPRTERIGYGTGVTFYQHIYFAGQSFGPYNERLWGDVESVNFRIPDDFISSIKIEGRYMVVLYEEKGARGKCEVFFTSNEDLRKNPIGQCNWRPFAEWQDCTSSILIIPLGPPG